MLKTLTIVQGDSYFVRVPLLKGGAPWPIAGWKFWWTVKRDQDDEDADAIAQKSSDEATIAALSSTEAYVIGSPDDTKGKDPGKCVFDIQGQSPEGDTYTLERGVVIIKAETTKAA